MPVLYSVERLPLVVAEVVVCGSSRKHEPVIFQYAVGENDLPLKYDLWPVRQNPLSGPAARSHCDLMEGCAP